MENSTSILDLPTGPTNDNNIKITAFENLGVQDKSNNSNDNNGNNHNNGAFSLDQTTINQIVNGLQQATISGETQLPSRDIPMITNNLTVDPQIHPNYIPKLQNDEDYIKNYDETTDIIDNYNKNVNRNNSLDELYNEIQVPILLTILYFLFQLPILKRYLFSYLPILFSKDGNLNLNGFVFTSVLFGFLYYLINKVNINFGKF
jgi:hypothetical protein